MENRYNKEYGQYYIYTLEQFLIKTYGCLEHDAKVKVMQDFDSLLLLSGGSCYYKNL